MSRLLLVTPAVVVFLSVIIAAIAIPGATLPRRMDTLGIAQVWVPAGCFRMGSDPVKDERAQFEELPAHHACLTTGYWIDQYDVTNAAFDAFVKADGYTTDMYWSREGLEWKKLYNISGPDTSCTEYSSDKEQPRVCVSWYEAEAYANWRTKTDKDGLLYHLPTEAEWEFAARGPLNWIYPWGNTFQTSPASSCPEAPGKLPSVGSNPTDVSWVGAQDMETNMWRWVADWYDDNYYLNALVNDPTGPLSGTDRVLRGGSWGNCRITMRAAFRNYYTPSGRDLVGGFRLVGVVPFSAS